LLGECPWYVDTVDLALLFKQDPRVIDEEWDAAWVDRVQMVLEARRRAALAKAGTAEGTLEPEGE
jgi:hypothetical protein